MGAYRNPQHCHQLNNQQSTFVQHYNQTNNKKRRLFHLESTVRSMILTTVVVLLAFCCAAAEDPPERNVEPAPNPPPSPWPTISPVSQPTGSPFSQPTLSPVSQPTLSPVAQPSLSPLLPTAVPSNQRETSPPTEAPVVMFSAPTVQSKEREGPTVFPSKLASSTQKDDIDDNKEDDNDTENVFADRSDNKETVEVSVPLQFEVSLQNVNRNEVDDLLPRIASVWRSHIRDSLREHYGSNVFRSVQLIVQERRTIRKRRTLQQQQDLDLVASGLVNLEFASGSVDPDTVTANVSDFLGDILRKERLQESLNASNIIVQIAGVPNDSIPAAILQRNNSTSKDSPTLVEMIIGFFILALALISLGFWASILYKKRQKRLRKRQLTALRKGPVQHHPSAMRNSRPITNNYKNDSSNAMMIPAVLPEGPKQSARDPSTPALKLTGRAETYNSSDDDDDNDSPYRGILSDDSTSSDPFGRELKQAASLDQAAWENFQRKKMEANQIEQRNTVATTPYIPTTTTTSTTTTTVMENNNDDNHEYYDDDTPEEQGIEVEVGEDPTSRMVLPTVGSFPYGDEEEEPSAILPEDSHDSRDVELGVQDSLGWGSAGIALKIADRYGTQDSGDFEPYGDGSPSRKPDPDGQRSSKVATGSLRDSWDLDENPVRDEGGPSQFSFLYPLKRQDISDQAIVDSVLDESDSQVSDSEGSEGFVTAAMLKQVAELSKFVQSYSQKRQSKIGSEIQQERDSNCGGLQVASVEASSMSLPSPAEASGSARYSLPGVPETTAGWYGDDSRRRPNDDEPKAYPIPPRTVLPSSFSSNQESLDISDDESASSQRLGINRFSVRKPNGPLLSYNNSNIGPPETASASEAPTDEAENYNRQLDGGGTATEMNIPKTISEAKPRKNGFSSGRPIGAPPLPRQMPPELDLPEPQDLSFPPMNAPARNATPVGNEQPGVVQTPTAVRRPMESTPLTRSRSKDKKFNNIVSMFENKAKTTVTPPNATVRGNGLVFCLHWLCSSLTLSFLFVCKSGNSMDNE